MAKSEKKTPARKPHMTPEQAEKRGLDPVPYGGKPVAKDAKKK